MRRRESVICIGGGVCLCACMLRDASCDGRETYLAVTLSTTLAETLATFSSSGHVDKSVVWLVGGGREIVVLKSALEEMRWMGRGKKEIIAGSVCCICMKSRIARSG